MIPITEVLADNCMTYSTILLHNSCIKNNTTRAAFPGHLELTLRWKQVYSDDFVISIA